MHVNNVFPYWLMQEVRHVLSLFNAFSDKSSGNFHQRCPDPFYTGPGEDMIKNRIWLFFCTGTGINIQWILADKFFGIFPFMNGIKVILSHDKNEFIVRKILFQPCKRIMVNDGDGILNSMFDALNEYSPSIASSTI